MVCMNELPNLLDNLIVWDEKETRWTLISTTYKCTYAFQTKPCTKYRQNRNQFVVEKSSLFALNYISRITHIISVQSKYLEKIVNSKRKKSYKWIWFVSVTLKLEANRPVQLWDTWDTSKDLPLSPPPPSCFISSSCFTVLRPRKWNNWRWEQ